MLTLSYIAIAATFLWLSWGRVTKALERRRLTHQHGCAPPAQLGSMDPILGLDAAYNLYRWVRSGQRMRNITTQCYQGNHTVKWLVNGKTGIWTTDPRNIHFVTVTESDNFVRAAVAKGPAKKLFSSKLFETNGQRLSQSRKLIAPTFRRAHITDRGLFGEHCELMLAKLPRDGSTVQMSDFFGRMIFDAAAHFVFGESVYTQDPERSSVGTEIKAALDDAMTSLMKQMIAGPFSSLVRHKTEDESCDIIHRFMDNCIDRAIKDEDRRSKNNNRILVYDLVNIYENRDILRAELFNVFFAALDTTSILLTNVVFLMARHPEEWAKLRNAVKDLDVDALTFENLRKIDYLQWALKETLRLHSPGPSLARSAMKPMTLPFGGGPNGDQPVALAVGDTVVSVFGGVHRRPDIFGPDADKFRPGRWQDLDLGVGEFTPFSAGPRACPGQDMAMFWAGYAVARLAMAVERVENRDEILEFVDLQKMTTCSRNGALVSLVFAEGS
ncbi:cytochrome p450 domain-containing protein [Sarocladium implicatum]|nr:cytochrome p450 domain-containing protein [Sarocladium implicatum]